MSKTAVILFNLGGPDSVDAVQPFLFNLFNDKAIIRLPAPFRYFLAKLISSKRAPTTKEIYSHINNKSPLLELTEEQAELLETKLNGGTKSTEETLYKTFVSMRYWHPFAKEVLQKTKEWGADKIVLLPLYPQFSTTTSASSIEEWKKEMKKASTHIPLNVVGCYFAEEHFIDAHVRLIKQSIEKIGGKPFRLLFSAHGLPEKIIEAGDPYQWQVEQTCKAVIEKLDKQGEVDYSICYQSRVGSLKWIGPTTENEIKRAGEDKKAIIITPIAFVSEHSETLVELDIEYREFALKHGVAEYIRVPALGKSKEFVASLHHMVTLAEKQQSIISHKIQRLCPKNFYGCACK